LKDENVHVAAATDCDECDVQVVVRMDFNERDVRVVARTGSAPLSVLMEEMSVQENVLVGRRRNRPYRQNHHRHRPQWDNDGSFSWTSDINEVQPFWCQQAKPGKRKEVRVSSKSGCIVNRMIQPVIPFPNDRDMIQMSLQSHHSSSHSLSVQAINDFGLNPESD
jgi:hypothetical protein